MTNKEIDRFTEFGYLKDKSRKLSACYQNLEDLEAVENQAKLANKYEWDLDSAKSILNAAVKKIKSLEADSKKYKKALKEIKSYTEEDGGIAAIIDEALK